MLRCLTLGVAIPALMACAESPSSVSVSPLFPTAARAGYINKDHPAPDSEESRAAMASCRQGIRGETRRSATSKGRLVRNPLYLGFVYNLAPVCDGGCYQARFEVGSQVSQCMSEKGWTECGYHDRRSDVRPWMRGAGWVCLRRP